MSKSLYCPTKNGLCHIVVDGNSNKSPIFFLGGLGSQWFDWHDTIHHLKSDYYLVRIDRPGYGKSPSWEKGRFPHLQSEIPRILDVKNFLHINQKLTLVAHSLGGFYAESFALIHPEETARIILVDPSIPEFPRPCRVPQKLHKLITDIIFEICQTLFLPELIGHKIWHRIANITPPYPLSQQRINRINLYARRSSYWRGAVMENFSFTYSAEQLRALWKEKGKNFTIPTLLISTQKHTPSQEHREILKLDLHRRYAQRLQAQHEIIYPSSHIVIYDQPKWLSQSISDFITQHARSES